MLPRVDIVVDQGLQIEVNCKLKSKINKLANSKNPTETFENLTFGLHRNHLFSAYLECS